MKKAIPLIVIILVGLGVKILNAQENVTSETECPIKVLAQKWFQLSEIRRSSTNNSQPITGPQSQVGGEIPNDTWKVTKKFIFEGKFKNISNKKILGFAWDYVIYDTTGLKELDRKKSIFANSLNSNKSETVQAKSTLPPNMTIDAGKLGDKAKMVEKIEIRCVVFNDKSNWVNKGFNETDCEDLRLALARRAKLKQLYAY